MSEAVEKFEVMVRHGAFCSRLEIVNLLEAYKEMEPSLHRHCGTPDVVDIEALLYSSDRLPNRSEERRVGKEGRSRWSPYH